MGNIEKRGANSWRIGEQISTDEGRAWIRRSLKFPSDMSEAEQRAQAEIALARLIVDIADGRAVPSTSYTVETFAHLWLEDYVRPNLSPNYYTTLENMLRLRIIPALGDVRLDKLTPIALTRFISGLKNEDKKTTALPPEQRKRKATQYEIDQYKDAKPQKLSNRTIKSYYDCLNSMLDKAVQWEKLSRNPMDKVDAPRYRKRKIKFLSNVEAVCLLRKLSDEENMSFRAAVLLSLLAGLRLGEVGGLRLTDVDWENNAIDISRAVKYTPTTGQFEGAPKSESGERPITLPPDMMTLLTETMAYQADVVALIGDRWRGDGRIVCSWDGSPLNKDTPSKWWRTYADKHGYEGVRFHDLRHSHAVLLFENKVDAVAVAHRLGHSDPATTLREYGHASLPRDAASADAMQRLLDRAKNHP